MLIRKLYRYKQFEDQFSSVIYFAPLADLCYHYLQKQNMYILSTKNTSV